MIARRARRIAVAGFLAAGSLPTRGGSAGAEIVAAQTELANASASPASTPLPAPVASPPPLQLPAASDIPRPVAPAASASVPSEKADALQRAAEQRRLRLAAFERRERGLLETLDEIDRASAELGRELAQSEVALADARLALADARAIARDAEAGRARAARALAGRARALHREGQTRLLRAVFSPGTLRDRIARVQLLRTLAARDARGVVRYRNADRLLAEARLGADAARAARDRASAETRDRRLALDGERDARSALLASLRGDRGREEAALAELEASARTLGVTLGRLGEAASASAATPDRAFALLRGRLPLPVDAPLSQGFGSRVDAQFGTRSFRKGVEFAARRGESVRAVAPGEVRFAGWFRGYGRTVIVDHGDRYFTVSGHLDEIGVASGDRVEAGREIGRAGDSGSLDGTRLHFEVRRGGDALDPAEWLAGVRRARTAHRRVE